MKCDWVGCDEEAIYGAILELRVHPKHGAATSDPILRVCEAHKGVTWGDLVSPGDWHDICNKFRRGGFQTPKQQYSNVKLVPLEKKQ